ncbi:MAG TPA: hypothetical protein VGI57_10550 [Usitatibacter sp.]
MRLLALFFFLPLAALAGGLDPWTFGMTAEQVLAQVDQGPYKSFSNGDLETYAGVFAGKKCNVQFYFRDGTLRRIVALTYESTDSGGSGPAWLHTYTALRDKYGEMETPGLSGKPEEMAVQAQVRVALGLKAQMAPVKQPKDEFVFSTFSSYPSGGKTWYRIVVNIDPPRNAP